MSCQEAFTRELRERGLRLTPQREMVLAAMHTQPAFATAEEIYARVQGVSSAVDISTVYRTLELLEELGVAAVVEGNDGNRRYGLTGGEGPHVHLVCHRCGQVIGVAQADVAPLLDQLCDNYGFLADPARLNIVGYCSSCRTEM